MACETYQSSSITLFQTLQKASIVFIGSLISAISDY